jgi:F-type H+-transporting ATPase subunit b
MTEHGAPNPTPGDLLWPALNFVLFVALLVYFLRGPIVEYFRARAEQLRDALAAGARARAEAEKLREAIARDMRDMPAIRQRLLDDLRAAAERERETLLGLGRDLAARIRSEARLVAEHEVAAARTQLRAEAIDEVVQRSAALIRAAVRPDDQERFVRDFVASAGASS